MNFDDNNITMKTEFGFWAKTLKNWLEVLPEKYFIQIHRSVILNINFVAEVTKWFNYTNKITLKGSEDVLYISQRYSRNLRSDAW